MLVENVVNARSIAYEASEAASNKIPYLGLNWFPETKRSGIDLKWIKTHKGLAPSLAPSNFDALPRLRARGGLDIKNTQMAFFRESMVVSETDMIDISRIEDSDDPFLKSALRSIYDDTNNLVSSAEVVPERMRMQLLAALNNGSPSIFIEADDVKYDYNYDPDGSYKSNNYLELLNTSRWTDAANSTPLDDLNNAKQALADNGYAPEYILLSTKVMGYLLKNEQIKSVLLTTNAAGTIYITEDMVIAAIKATTGLTPVKYDKQFLNESGVGERFYPEDRVTLLPNAQLGKTVFGTTPEERTIGQVADVDIAIYGTGIAIATKPEYGPPYKFSTTASEIVLPTYELMDSTYVIKVA